ncbi:MAG: DNA helicase RecQ [Anaerolineae bacterium]|nr:DNA helicase RecQ [Anaerolineae bacterium]
MSQTPIFTIGYGKREIDDFLAVLKANNIAFLIDVRSQPYSRYKPDFSRQELAQHVQSAGIRYVYMGQQLGGRPTDPEALTNGTVDYDKMRQTDTYQAGIGRLQDAHSQQFRVAIMCSEGKPEECHRSRLIGETLTERGIPVTHIDENDVLITQEAVRLRMNGQTDLFTTAPKPAPTTPRSANPTTLLKQIFGYDEFRPLQAELIDNVLNKRDSLAVMPTGSGKSICYQLPALIFPGLTVVVSPLISLMEDQVDQLREVGVTAVTLNSSLPQHQYLDNMQQIHAGAVNMLYVAPETLLRPDLLDLLERIPVDCLTIDEAHCISEWGHDFRPEYRQLIDVRRRLPHAVCLAVTATATDHVRADIKNSLAIADADEFIASFNRENLFLAVQPKTDGLTQTLAFLKNHPDESGIIYCATRKQVDTLTEQLQAHGYQVLPYHAGLDADVRTLHQRQFIHDNVPIMVATIAFGMGINKSNVRFVLHYDLPKNLESYYQQIGRAGRDGLHSDCLLLFSYSDVQTINYFIMQQDPSQQIGARTRLDAMLAFVETNICRRKPLLTYFGETYDIADCETCDNCTTEEGDLMDVTIPAQKFLSCVKRTGELFGTNHIIDVLRGSQSQKVLSRNHQRLSTYNIGGEYSKKQWQFLARQFIQQGLLVQDMEHGSLKLTEAGYAVFNGASVQGSLPAPEAPSQATAPMAPHDVELFHLLREKRKELAQAHNVPPYVIFSDRTLVEMAIYFPQSPYRLGELYGVGATKLENYAEAFLPIIQAYCAEKGIEEKLKTAVSFSSGSVTGIVRTRSNKSRTEEVADLFNAGQSIDEIAQIFGVKHGTVLSHLWKTVQSGAELRGADDIIALSRLSAEEQEQVLMAFDHLGFEALGPVFHALGETISYDELHILRLHFVTSRMP